LVLIWGGGAKEKIFPVVFMSAGKNNITFKGKPEFLRNVGFRQNRFWLLV